MSKQNITKQALSLSFSDMLKKSSESIERTSDPDRNQDKMMSEEEFAHKVQQALKLTPLSRPTHHPQQ